MPVAIDLTDPHANTGTSIGVIIMLIVGIGVAGLILAFVALAGIFTSDFIERELGEYVIEYEIDPWAPLVFVLALIVLVLLIYKKFKPKQEIEDTENSISYKPLEPSRSGEE